MRRAILWRILSVIPVLLIMSVLTFLVGRFSKGDPIKNSLSGVLSAEQIEAIRQA